MEALGAMMSLLRAPLPGEDYIEVEVTVVPEPHYPVRPCFCLDASVHNFQIVQTTSVAEVKEAMAALTAACGECQKNLGLFSLNLNVRGRCFLIYF